MRPHRTYAPAPRATVDQVLSEARHAVATARAQRDQLEAALRDVQADNAELRRKLDHVHQAPVERDGRADRLAADLENLRRQHAAALERTRIETLTRSVEPLADLIDHLGRALATNPDPENPWFKGTAALLARTRASLAGLGVGTVGAMGDRFDPALHDAIGTVRTADLAPGSLVDVVKTGLVLLETGTLIRPATVVVAEGVA
ncbi:MAG: nucleotide exchange factor GrpE [Myxococcota bacterium]